jgi:hypothetical protein
MKRYSVAASLLSPLAVKRDRQSERSEGISSVLGTLLRGALAQAYLQEHGETDERFRRLFQDETTCRFGPLDPAHSTLPLTACTCKRYPGFLADGQHGVADILWNRVARRLSPARDRIGWQTCARCGEDVKPLSGFYTPASGNSAACAARSSTRVVAAHVGIDRTTSTAAESIFFTLEALEPGPDPHGSAPDLVGWIDADDWAHGQLLKLISAEDSMITLGHARTRGYGRVRIELREALPGTEDHDAREHWSSELLAFLGRPEFGIGHLDPSRCLAFALTLPTGAVLVDDLLRATQDPADAVEWLPRIPSVDDPGSSARDGREVEGGILRWVGGVTRHERLRGWNAAHGLPRQDEWAVARGSVFAYLFEGGSDGRAALHDRLDQVERQGIGLRRNEGFGDVVVSDAFHREYLRQEGHP